MSSTKPSIGVVGPCKSGKSTLVRGLHEHGFEALQIAQEHSFSPSMWQKIANPDILIYLHSEYESTVERGLKWTPEDYENQQPRLAHAREHADFEIASDVLPPEEVLQRVLDFLKPLT
jgi:deoxyadenosine/deoxycytidine kinase